MTLVAGFSMGGPPAFVGDLLTSWKIPTEISLPTRPTLERHEASDGFFAHGLAQKLVIVRPYLLVAWAGSVSEAKKLITYLDAELPALYRDMEGKEHALLSVLDQLPSSLEVVAVILDEEWIRPFCVHTRGFSLGDKRFYLLGSGNETIFQFLVRMSEDMPEPDNSEGVAAISLLINFAGNALMAQHVSKFGLSESWGGGFEVVYVTKDGFRKADNILVRCWSLDSEWTLGNVGTSFLMHYEGTTLKLSSFGNSDRITTIESWLRKSSVISRSDLVAEWTVDLFYLAATGQHICTVQKEFPWSRSSSRFFFDQGALVGWNMDRSRIEKIVDKIKQRDALSAPFTSSTL